MDVHVRARRRVTPGAVAGLQLSAAIVDGVALSTIVLHVTAHLGLAPTVTGGIIASAALAALALTAPIGMLADRVGTRRVAAFGAVASAVALAGYAAAGSVVVYAASAVVFTVAQAATGAMRQALAVAGIADADRPRTRAAMHALANVGMGVGTVIGALLGAATSDEAFRAAYLAAAVVSVGAAVWTARLAAGARVARGDKARMLLVVRDARFLRVTALAVLVQLTMPVLTVLLPIWVLQHTTAPTWASAAALTGNTVLVIVVQVRWSARVRDAASAARSARWAAVGMLLAGVALAASGLVAAAPWALALVGVGAVALTLGEVAGGAATWWLALRSVPAHAEGRYQSAFATSTSAARILGSAVALPLLLATASAGWLLLAAAMTLACLALAGIAARASA